MEENERNAEAKLFEALAAVQGSLKPAELDSTNPLLHNKYASLGSVWDSTGLRDALATYGLSVIQAPVGYSTNGEPWIAVDTVIVHKDGGRWSSSLAIPLGQAGKGRNLAQEAGSIITYLRRYSLASIFGIVAEEDTDGNRPPRQQAAKKEPAKQQPPKDDEAATYWAQLGPTEKLVYRSWSNVESAIMDTVDRYKGNPFGANGAIHKLFPKLKGNEPVAQTADDGRTRVSVYRTVKAYAQLRDAGMEGKQAESQAFETAKNLLHS